MRRQRSARFARPIRDRPASANSRRSNPNGVVPQSPGLARRQPWVIAPQVPSTPTGLRPGSRKASGLRSPPATTPLGLRALPSPLPRVVPSVQPWALFRDRFAVDGNHQTKRTRAAALADYDQISAIMSNYHLSRRRRQTLGDGPRTVDCGLWTVDCGLHWTCTVFASLFGLCFSQLTLPQPLPNMPIAARCNSTPLPFYPLSFVLYPLSFP